jgi:hypothetical protein
MHSVRTPTPFIFTINMSAMRYHTCAVWPSVILTHSLKMKMKPVLLHPTGCTIGPVLLRSSVTCLEIRTREATAEAELDGLCMWTNQKFMDFLVEFNTLSSQVNWGDCTLHHRLKQALPDCIKDSLALVEEPVVFNDWKCLVQNVDQWYWE